MTLLLQLVGDLASLAVLLGSGFLVARAVLGRVRREEEFAAALLFAATAPGILAFSVDLLAGAFVKGWHVAVAAGSCGLVAAAVLAWRGGWREPADAHGPGGRIALSLAALSLAIGLVAYDNSHFRYACVNSVVAAAITPESGLERARPPGNDPAGGEPRMDLAESSGTGQRYGTTAVILGQVALFDFFGFRWAFALLRALGALHAFLLGRMLVRDRTWAGVVAWAVATLHPMLLKIVLLDENDLSFHLGTAATYWLIRSQPSAVLGGLAAGAHVGIRHIGVGLLPAGLLLLWANRREAPAKARVATLATFGVVFALSTMPCIIHHQAAYGTLFTEEHFHDEVRVPPYRYGFGGLSFEYAGLLNWPLRDELIRAPYNPLPTMLYHPVHLITHQGLLVTAAALLGLWTLLRTRTVLLLALAMWAGPALALLSVLELWMDPIKMGIPVTFFAWLVVAVPLGFDGLKRRWPALAALAVLSFVAVKASLLVEAPPDPRAYAAFPAMRPEHPAYRDWARAEAGRVWPWPGWSRVLDVGEPRFVRSLADVAGEWVDRGLARPSVPPAASPEPVVLRLDLTRPLVGRSDFFAAADPGEPGDVVDLMAADAAVLLEGLRVDWADRPADVLLARTQSGVGVFLKFGKESFVDLEDRHFHAEPVHRPSLVRRPAPASGRLVLRKPRGLPLTLIETINTGDGLLLRWDVRDEADRVEVSRTRRYFHN